MADYIEPDKLRDFSGFLEDHFAEALGLSEEEVVDTAAEFLADEHCNFMKRIRKIREITRKEP